MSVCVIIVEIIHILLVTLNVISDSYVLWNMYDYKEKFETSQSIGQSAPNFYNYSFCYPTIYPPQWFIESNTTMVNCSCSSIHIHCNNTNDDDGDVLHNDMNCENQYWAVGTEYQQIFTIDDWQCQTCECDGSKYEIEESLPIQKILFEYNILTITEQHSYCTPQSMVNHVWSEDMPNNLLQLIICSWVFVCLGCMCQCGCIGVRIWYINDEGLDWYNIDDKREYKARDVSKLESVNTDNIPEIKHKDVKEYFEIGKAISVETTRKGSVLENQISLNGLRLILQFITSIFHDIPHTIIGIYYVTWEYSDYGSQCFTLFIHDEYPKLTKAQLDPNDSFAVIVAKNVVLWSYVASFAVILFNAYVNAYQMFNAFNTKNAVSTDYWKAQDNRWYIVYFLIFLNSFAYVFAIWCPTFGVIYFSIAATFYKTWNGMFGMFIFGCVSWVIMCCSGAALIVSDGFGVV
eukprot:536734_1